MSAATTAHLALHGHPLTGLTKDTSEAVARISAKKVGAANPQYGKRGAEAGHWISGKTRARGYTRVRAPNHPRAHNGYVSEHVLVAESEVGRLLTDAEIVHHIDTRRSNNAPDNLFVTDAGGHKRAHVSLARLIPELIARGVIQFDRERGEYSCPV